VSPPDLDQPFVQGSIETPVGPVPRVTSSLTHNDRWGTFKVRWGIGRMNYKVQPGLYALGNPSRQSPVLVTANYKLSFDTLRRSLPEFDAWVLVLDTDGVNVWCAAGKGTFSTAELVNRIKTSSLAEVVDHRQVILPQLGAPGVAVFQVNRLSGFKAVIGPIRASDIPAFMEMGCKASPEMRRKTFPMGERVVLIPLELAGALKPVLIIIPLLFLLGGVGGPSEFWNNSLNFGLFAIAALLMAILAGAVLTPILLPWLPGRAFSFKGFLVGLVVSVGFLVLTGNGLASWAERLYALSWMFLIPAASAFLAMNFTGASTYTSLSGVRKEMRYAVPLEGGAAGAGLILWIAARITL